MEMLNTFKTGKSFLSRKIYLYSTLALMAGGGGEATYSLCLYVGNGIKISFTCTSPEGVGECHLPVPMLVTYGPKLAEFS